MRTTASNRRIRVILTDVKDKKLIPKPDFQRRLVWTTKDKRKFLDTVLRGYPFPEIYIAAGEVDTDTGAGTELLVDGQQRVMTLFQYFTGSKELDIGKEIPLYTQLTHEQKTHFLEYEVVVRDLGKMEIDEIKAVFERINATKYSLNDMEIHNARFAGEFKSFAEEIAQNTFFEKHRIFSANEIRRMGDVRYALTLVITIMSTYFNRDDELEVYLGNYNDDFPTRDSLKEEIQKVFDFVESCNFEDGSRVWKRSDLFTLLVEVHKAIFKLNLNINPQEVGRRVSKFYFEIENKDQASQDWAPYLNEYTKFSIQATNDRNSRIKRGEIIQRVIQGE